MNNKGRLTGRHKVVFDLIVAYKKANDGISPTLREIILNTDITSTSVVKWYLNNLENLGLIEVPKKSYRGIKVIGGKWTYQKGEDEQST